LTVLFEYKGDGRKFSGGVMEKTRPKNSTIKNLSTLSVSCMKIQGRGGHSPLAPASDAHVWILC